MKLNTTKGYWINADNSDAAGSFAFTAIAVNVRWKGQVSPTRPIGSLGIRQTFA